MAATVRISNYTGATESAVAASGVRFGRDDLQTSTATIPAPTSPGTNYSWRKTFALEVTAAGSGTTKIANRSIARTGAPVAGINLFFLTPPPSTYAQATSGNKPADDTVANDALPAGGYALARTGHYTWYPNMVTIATGRSGSFLVLVLGRSALYTGGANAALAVPAHALYYDEQ